MLQKPSSLVEDISGLTLHFTCIYEFRENFVTVPTIIKEKPTVDCEIQCPTAQCELDEPTNDLIGLSYYVKTLVMST